MARIKLNSPVLQSYLDGGDGVREMLRGKAEAGAAAMRQSAPADSGDYRASITVWEDRTDRLVVRYGATVPYAGVVEANHGTAARSIDSAR